MSSVRVQLSDSIKQYLEQLAERAGVPVDEYMRRLIERSLSSSEQLEYLEERACRADPEAVQRIMDRVRSRPPVPGDERP